MRKTSYVLVIILILMACAFVFAQIEKPFYGFIKNTETPGSSNIAKVNINAKDNLVGSEAVLADETESDGISYPEYTLLKGMVTDIRMPGPYRVADATITVEGELLAKSRITKSDVMGNYEVRNLAAGEYIVTISKQGYKNSIEHVTVNLGREKFHDISLYGVGNPQYTLLKGRVTDTKIPRPNIITGATITVESEMLLAESESTISDSRGYYEVWDIPAGVYTVKISKPGYEGSMEYVNVNLGKETFHDANLYQIVMNDGTEMYRANYSQRGLIKGKVTDTKTPRPKNLAGSTIIVESGLISEPIYATSDAAGNYEVPNLPPGEYALTITKPGYEDYEEYVVVTSGRETFHDVRLYDVDILLGAGYKQSMRVGVYAAIVRDGSILLTEFGNEEGRHFKLPGAGIHTGESLHDVLRRRVRKQISADIEVGKLLLVWEYEPVQYRLKYGYARKLGLIFLCKLRGNNEPKLPTTLEFKHVGVGWTPISELPNVQLLPQISERLIKALELAGNEDIFCTEI